ncbi:SGNH/GDSL hydrolase family protein [Aeromicrobium sp.]|uniref:SGNH/GDSL hydrolase family protein n=1 Tax=Aeromicrobium sp. TaxID=1871063 RepID=UPI003C69FB75
MTPRLGAAALLICALLAACQGSDSTGPARPPFESYVAMGDSFVSGPGILPHDPDSGICLRSERDYPALLAEQLRIPDFTDVSCGGAITDHLTGPAQTTTDPLPAQLDALTGDTRLVTIGIGGNDGNFYEGLFNSCFYPAYRSVSGCAYFAESQADTILAVTRPKIARALRAVQQAAPRAEIILVGYLRIVPDAGSCGSLDIGGKQVADAAAVTRAVDSMQRAAARDAGATYVSLRAISEGHDACAGSAAWVNGLTNTVSDGVALHPRPAGMRAAAGHLANVLTAP